VLLPWISERWALVVLSLPWLIIGLRPMRVSNCGFAPRVASYLLLPLALALFLASKDYEQQYGKSSLVLRDSTATVIATGSGMNRRLLVNGYGMTSLTPITKMMAHLPLAFLDRPPQDALVICFGMGTTFRSLRTWDIPVTVVELVPSVPRLFGYFHSDAVAVLSSPLSHVVIDDGRRYLERTAQQYDVITIDPPPPVEAAGSSLLYSENFYSVVRQRLRPGGILQQWLPVGDAEDKAAVATGLAPVLSLCSSICLWKRLGISFSGERTGLSPNAPPASWHTAFLLERPRTSWNGNRNKAWKADSRTFCKMKCRSSSSSRCRAPLLLSAMTGQSTSTSCCAGCLDVRARIVSGSINQGTAKSGYER